MRALADTSLFVAVEQDRPRAATIPDEICVSVVTVAELRLGVIMADDPSVRARRLDTAMYVEKTFEPIPIDEAVAHRWAAIVEGLRRKGRRAPINDIWIAATALSRGLPVVTQDGDYDAIDALSVVRV
jgi:predicted nucleic acid-binding protein